MRVPFAVMQLFGIKQQVAAAIKPAGVTALVVSVPATVSAVVANWTTPGVVVDADTIDAQQMPAGAVEQATRN
jgi:hypothetical protein